MTRRPLLPLLYLALVLMVPAQAAFGAGPGGGKPEIAARNCATPEPTIAEMEMVKAQVDQWLSENAIQATGGQIKVAFHVIYSGNTGNIPQSQIDAQINELNLAYSGAHGGANTGYTFVLASVSRTNSSKWFKMTPGSAAERQAKQALAVDIPHRLNVYTCKPGQNLLGWSYLPNSYPEGDWHHGVVIHYGSVPGGYLSPYNLGGTLDHEAGHYLGLYHTFQNGCNAPGDQVADTPDEATATSGCPSGKDTCPTAGLDPIHNYMDYSTDVCYTQFTTGQDTRMDNMVTTYKPSLLNAAAIATLAGTRSTGGAQEAMLRVPVAGSVQLRGAFPNPFRGQTAVRFALPRAERVSLKVYNVAGQLVQTLVDGDMAAGEQTVMFRGQRLPNGMYFLSLRVGGVQTSRSIIKVE